MAQSYAVPFGRSLPRGPASASGRRHHHRLRGAADGADGNAPRQGASAGERAASDSRLRGEDREIGWAASFIGLNALMYVAVQVNTVPFKPLIGATSVDGKRFVMADEDGPFDGTVIDNDTLDYCYLQVTATDRAVACGLLRRKR